MLTFYVCLLETNTDSVGKQNVGLGDINLKKTLHDNVPKQLRC